MLKSSANAKMLPGPTLFLVYTNDLPDDALLGIRKYADDNTAYSSIETSDFFDRLEMTSEMVGGLTLYC